MFRRFLFLRISLGLVVGAAVASAQSGILVGEARAVVVERLGPPSGTAQMGAREVLYYQQGAVVLVDGRVERTSVAVRPSPVATPRPKPSPATGMNAAAPVVAGTQVPTVVPTAVAATRGVDSAPTTAGPLPRSTTRVSREWPVLTTWFVLFVVLAGAAVWVRGWRRGRKARRRSPAAGVAAAAPRGDGEAVGPMAPVWAEVDTSVWSMALLRALEWHRFEQVVAEYFRRLGYRAELTGFGPDGGVDVVVSRLTESSPCVLVQCKAWSADVIGVRWVRELYGVAAARGIKACAFFTTSTFHADALAFAGTVAMDCADGADVLQRIRALPAEDQAALLAVATAGDFRTPTCCACGVKMVPRTGPTQSVFFGCRNFPRCRQTLAVGTPAGTDTEAGKRE